MIDMVGSRSLTDLWREQVEARPDKQWLVFEDADGKVVDYTYRQFDAAVAETAAGFSAVGVGRGDAVVLHLRNCPEYVMCWLALASLGAVMVPSNVANTATELRQIVDRSHAAVVVTGETLADVTTAALAGLTSDVPTVVVGGATSGTGIVGFDAFVTGQQPPPVSPGPASEDMLEILFTSGTTAAPKGVVTTHANALWAGEVGARGLGLDEHDRCLTALPLFHVNGQAVTVLAALTVGATVVLLEEFTPATYLEQVRRHGATQTSLVAQQALALLREPPSPHDRDHALRRVVFAINISDEAKDSFETRFGVRLTNIYGMSEAMAIVSMTPLDRPQRWPSIGMPALSRTLRIVDDDGGECAPGEIGEIQVHGVPGRTVFREYFEDPDATAAALVDGWIRTGDAGYLDESGYLFFYERLKDVIKCSGQNVAASEVEAVLDQHPGVRESAVIGIPSERRGETVMAFVVLAEGATVGTEDLLAHCQERLSRYKVPEFFELCDSLPRTSVGKLAKRELRDRVR